MSDGTNPIGSNLIGLTRAELTETLADLAGRCLLIEVGQSC